VTRATLGRKQVVLAVARVPGRACPGAFFFTHTLRHLPGQVAYAAAVGAIVGDNLGTGSDSGWMSSPVSFAATAARSTSTRES
jgi:hypothetical protein